MHQPFMHEIITAEQIRKEHEFALFLLQEAFSDLEDVCCEGNLSKAEELGRAILDLSRSLSESLNDKLDKISKLALTPKENSYFRSLHKRVRNALENLLRICIHLTVTKRFKIEA
jgi:hypothetical protein